MTYSIVARDATTGETGAAVQTHQMCVGAGVPWVDESAGAIATQALTNVSFGPLGLEMLRRARPGIICRPEVATALERFCERFHPDIERSHSMNGTKKWYESTGIWGGLE